MPCLRLLAIGGGSPRDVVEHGEAALVRVTAVVVLAVFLLSALGIAVAIF